VKQKERGKKIAAQQGRTRKEERYQERELVGIKRRGPGKVKVKWGEEDHLWPQKRAIKEKGEQAARAKNKSKGVAKKEKQFF